MPFIGAVLDNDFKVMDLSYTLLLARSYLPQRFIGNNDRETQARQLRYDYRDDADVGWDQVIIACIACEG